MSSAASQYIRDVLHQNETPPPVLARFFYTSTLALDDPLSPLPPPAASGAAVSKGPPRPFSEYDNDALDQSWHELRSKILRWNEEQSEKPRPAEMIVEEHLGAEELKEQGKGKGIDSSSGGGGGGSIRRGTVRFEGSRPKSSSDASIRSSQATPPTGLTVPNEHASNNRRASSSSRNARSRDFSFSAAGQGGGGAALLPADAEAPSTTGTPFIRAPSRRHSPALRIDRNRERVRHRDRDRSKSGSRPRPHALDSYKWDAVDASAHPDTDELEEERNVVKGPEAKVPVGVSMLHHVVMPGLELEPIYWHPVNDVAPVLRATWFYQENMMPVETDVANMLEAGYVELQPWTETWADELNSAVQVGAAGEMKVVHRLWPEQPAKTSTSESRPGTSRGEVDMMTVTAVLNVDSPEKQHEKIVEAACDIIDISTGPGGADNKAAGASTYGLNGTTRKYATAAVIYSNAREATILKPSLQPSAYYGRRPLANYIRKGRKLGIAVVRGFDQTLWDKLHPPKKGTPMSKAADKGVSTSQAGAAEPAPGRRQKKDAHLAKSERPKVTDLVLVIHGIGQKLSERMESFHFTHAINAFRREVNVELGTDGVKAQLRPDMGGIMVLPVNWRQCLSFEEGGYRDESINTTSNEFTLKDITPSTLPSVRNIVSDVMLDIPYYLSHHQPKMISAVISEANRIYKLWCANNPGFSTNGRVHIIAHSLGSVMAVDILSRQPTHIPAELADPTTVDLDATPSLQHFLFRTSNLFLAGSPVGFFLLLKRACLLPRLDFNKAGASAADIKAANQSSVCAEAGTYGCLAVENLYNIINPYDPVSYRLNAAVDAQYAHSLKPAWIPSAGGSWGVGSWFYSSAEGKPPEVTLSAAATAAAAAGPGKSSQKPLLPSSGATAGQLPRLPSNVELEIHDFSREEIAEKRMLLLNDNGQVDFLLRYGGGPLEIQYLTMLGAHSSYWLLRDFVRVVVVEVGRVVGREGTGIGMRAGKRKAGL